MSWYTDPQLFIHSDPIRKVSTVFRISKEFGSPLQAIDFGLSEGSLDFIKHLALVNHKESDFDAFRNTFPTNLRIWKLINSHGLVATWDDEKRFGVWSHEEPNSPFWSSPPKTSVTEKQGLEESRSGEKEKADRNINEKQADLEKRVAALEAANANSQRDEVMKLKNEKKALTNDLEIKMAERVSLEKAVSNFKDEIASLKDKNKELTEDLDLWKEEISNVQQQLDREKKDKQSLEKEVLQLKAKLEECCGAGSGSADRETWMSGTAFPSTYVPFEELNDQAIPSTRRPLIVTKTSGTTPIFGEVDYTTNVQTSYFYRGMLNARMAYPIVLVNISELLPNKEKARFDSNVWSLFNNAGTYYAARKPFESETST